MAKRRKAKLRAMSDEEFSEFLATCYPKQKVEICHHLIDDVEECIDIIINHNDAVASKECFEYND